MATAKLTLSADRDTIELAKSLAAEDNISVSKLFKSLINELAKKKDKKDPLLEKLKTYKIPPELEAITGILKGKYPDDMDYKDMKYEYLKDKYGVSWQVAPEILPRLMGDPDPKKSSAVMMTMMKMKKIIIKDLQAAYDNA